MSYYTRLELNWDDGDYAEGSLTAEGIAAAAAKFVEERGWGTDVLADLKASASGEGLDRPGYNRIEAIELIEMLGEVSRAFPTVIFFARGVGEEYFDTWGRHFRGGEIAWEFGPLDPTA